jgi:PAS domain S-box-containing protein
MSLKELTREELICKVEYLSMQVKLLQQTQQELLKTKQSFQESEGRYRTAFECTGTAMLLIEEDTTVSMWNNKLEEVSGYTQEDAQKGRKWIEFVVEEELPRLLEYHKNRRLGLPSPSEYEFRMKHRDGGFRDMFMSVGMIPNSKKSIISLVDITQRKKIETALRRSEEEYRDLFENANDMIYMHDQNGMITAANTAALSTLEYEPDNIGSIAIRDIVAPEYLPFVMSKIGELTEQNPRSTRFEILAYSKSKKSLWIEVRLRAIWKNGVFFGIQGIARDVTERKKAEEAKLEKAQNDAKDARLMVKKLRMKIDGITCLNTMASRNPSMKQLFEVMPNIAQSDATVLLLGESGTGKELIARELHKISPRKNKNFVAINCSALPDLLLESELFGYKAGAFTDAKKDRAGKLSFAGGGTLFLDEIGDISPAMQVKLLRVLQEREFQPLGGNETERMNARVIAATNKNLQELVKKGMIREDFYYRIKVLPLTIPPLRERRCDLPLLYDHLIEKFNIRYSKSITELSDEVNEVLLRYDFPGNIRELENIFEHAFILCNESVIKLEHLPSEFRGPYHQRQELKTLASLKNLKEVEKLYIESVLFETGGNKLEASRRLEMNKTTLFRKIKKLGINK